jgi:hypothetical protein
MASMQPSVKAPPPTKERMPVKFTPVDLTDLPNGWMRTEFLKDVFCQQAPDGYWYLDVIGSGQYCWWPEANGKPGEWKMYAPLTGQTPKQPVPDNAAPGGQASASGQQEIPTASPTGEAALQQIVVSISGADQQSIEWQNFTFVSPGLYMKRLADLNTNNVAQAATPKDQVVAFYGIEDLKGEAWIWVKDTMLRALRYSTGGHHISENNGAWVLTYKAVLDLSQEHGQCPHLYAWLFNQIKSYWARIKKPVPTYCENFFTLLCTFLAACDPKFITFRINEEQDTLTLSMPDDWKVSAHVDDHCDRKVTENPIAKKFLEDLRVKTFTALRANKNAMNESTIDLMNYARTTNQKATNDLFGWTRDVFRREVTRFPDHFILHEKVVDGIEVELVGLSFEEYKMQQEKLDDTWVYNSEQELRKAVRDEIKAQAKKDDSRPGTWGDGWQSAGKGQQGNQ